MDTLRIAGANRRVSAIPLAQWAQQPCRTGAWLDTSDIYRRWRKIERADFLEINPEITGQPCEVYLVDLVTKPGDRLAYSRTVVLGHETVYIEQETGDEPR